MNTGPRSATHPALAFLRLELADALRSRWLLFTGASYGLVFGAFVWFGLRESSVLGFTGISRVVLNMAHAVVVVLPLVALVATSQAVVGPVGFFLANALGAARTLAVGVAWPLLLGVVTSWVALRRLERMDAVG